MRTTINLRHDLVQEAMAISNITEKTALLHAGLEALIAAEAAKRLARLGGSDPKAAAGRRRRMAVSLVLVDTSVWIEHFRYGVLELAALPLPH